MKRPRAWNYRRLGLAEGDFDCATPGSAPMTWLPVFLRAMVCLRGEETAGPAKR
jgi:hypothetical protein